MIDITHKSTTLRNAKAQAIVTVSKQETIDAVQNNTVPKGNVLEAARIAGLFAAKQTADMIPDCHPLPIEYTNISYQIKDLNIYVFVEVSTIYKTGVEVEAMHAASVVALTMYDMLKPIDKQIEINNIKLVEKKGGKSDFNKDFRTDLMATVIVTSDGIASGKKTDKAGQIVLEKLKPFNIGVSDYTIIPDEFDLIQEKIKNACINKANLIIITGGTGVTKRDTTPEAVKPLLEKEIPGIAETARNYGQIRTPHAMFSRSVSGLIGNTLVITIPGSSNGAKETMDALFPAVLHMFKK